MLCFPALEGLTACHICWYVKAVAIETATETEAQTVLFSGFKRGTAFLSHLRSFACVLWVIAEDTDAWLDATLPAEECACEALNTRNLPFLTAGFHHLRHFVSINH